jgi:hypothetical protein
MNKLACSATRLLLLGHTELTLSCTWYGDHSGTRHRHELTDGVIVYWAEV